MAQPTMPAWGRPIGRYSGRGCLRFAPAGPSLSAGNGADASRRANHDAADAAGRSREHARASVRR